MKIVLKNADKNLQYALDELALEFPLSDGETIELETKNFRVIKQRRLLKCKSMPKGRIVFV